jgi:hypothetical protein
MSVLYLRDMVQRVVRWPTAMLVVVVIATALKRSSARELVGRPSMGFWLYSGQDIVV